MIIVRNENRLRGAPSHLSIGQWTAGGLDIGEPTFRLTAVGDILLSGAAGQAIACTGNPSAIFRSLTPVLNSSDLAFGNLESPLIAAWMPGSTFAGSQAWAVGLRTAGFDVLHLASNHILDYEAAGFQQTISAVDEAGIRSLGVGQTDDEATSLCRFRRGELQIGWLAAGHTRLRQPRSPRLAELDVEQLVRRCQRASQQVDLLLVSLHWGPMLVDYPYPEQRVAAQRMVDAGAAAVIMHHAHVLQGVEIYRDAPICYNLGNCLCDPTEGLMQQASNFQYCKLAEQLSSCVFQFGWRGTRFVRLLAAPFVIPHPADSTASDFSLTWADPSTAQTILARLQRISEDLSADFQAKAEEQLWQNRRHELLVNLNLIVRRRQLWRIAYLLGKLRPDVLRSFARQLHSSFTLLRRSRS